MNNTDLRKHCYAMGYSDDEEIAYLFQKKSELLLEYNRHSTAFATLEELKMLQSV